MTTRTKIRIYRLIAIVILLGGNTLILLPSKSSIPSSIGTSLVASGVVVLLDLWYKSIVDGDAGSLDTIVESGLVSVCDRRDLEKYHALMKSVSNRLDIAGYSLRAFYESFAQVLLERLRANTGLRVRLLVVDPNSTHSRTKEELEGHARGTFAGNIELLKKTFGSQPNVQIRTLGSDLTTMVFRLDKTMFVGPQFFSAPSRATVTMELAEGKDSWLFRAYEKEFDVMWDRGHAI